MHCTREAGVCQGGEGETRGQGDKMQEARGEGDAGVPNLFGFLARGPNKLESPMS
jgi:hypothetical protein